MFAVMKKKKYYFLPIAIHLFFIMIASFNLLL